MKTRIPLHPRTPFHRSQKGLHKEGLMPQKIPANVAGRMDTGKSHSRKPDTIVLKTPDKYPKSGKDRQHNNRHTRHSESGGYRTHDE